MLEFTRQGEMLRYRVNGQIMEDLRYLGGNDFSGGVGKTGMAIKFEPKEKGMSATVVFASEPEKPLTGTKLLRY